MVAIDTNVLVRLLTGDHPVQLKACTRLFATEQIFIPDTVVLEAERVLRAAYELEPTDICDAFRRVFGLGNVSLANAGAVAQAISWHESGLDFTDALHLALSQDRQSLKTFDGALIRRADNLGRCRVERP